MWSGSEVAETKLCVELRDLGGFWRKLWAVMRSGMLTLLAQGEPIYWGTRTQVLILERASDRRLGMLDFGGDIMTAGTTVKQMEEDLPKMTADSFLEKWIGASYQGNERGKPRTLAYRRRYHESVDSSYSIKAEASEDRWTVKILDPAGAVVFTRACGDEVEARTFASTVRQHIDWLSPEKLRQYYRIEAP